MKESFEKTIEKLNALAEKCGVPTCKPNPEEGNAFVISADLFQLIMPIAIGLIGLTARIEALEKK